MTNLQLRQARAEDMPVVLALVSEASAWLAERGIEQWASPPGPEVRQLLAREIGAGEVYLAQVDESGPMGMLRFEWHDVELWPADPDGGGYVHTLVVRPGYHGQALGAGILSWAAGHVRARRRRYLRLDCVADNDRLRRYYAGLGFRECGAASSGNYRGALFELDLQAESDANSAAGASV